MSMKNYELGLRIVAYIALIIGAVYSSTNIILIGIGFAVLSIRAEEV